MAKLFPIFNPMNYVLMGNGSGGGGSSTTLLPLRASSNGRYEAPSGSAYNPVTVEVPVPGEEVLGVSKNGVYTPSEGYLFSSVSVNVPTFDERGVDELDVNFIDYDGVVLYSYTKSEFLSLTSMPTNPAHTGLVSQGWNWTLEDAKAWVSAHGSLTVGQSYVTDDGDTRIYIHVDNANRSTFKLNFGAPAGTIIVWGDGNTSAVSGAVTETHEYGAAGNYVIKIRSLSPITISNYTESTNLFGSVASGAPDRVYDTMVERIELGDNVTALGPNALQFCYGLRTITIPDTMISIGSLAFRCCYGLQAFVAPSTLMMMGDSAFFYNHALKRVSLNRSVDMGTNIFYYCYALNGTIDFGYSVIDSYVCDNCYNLSAVNLGAQTIIGQYAFRNNLGLTQIVIPETVSQIKQYAFYGCTGLKAIYVQRSTPPTLASSTCLSGIPADCVIYVPSGSVDTYKAASNWSVYATQIQEAD